MKEIGLPSDPEGRPTRLTEAAGAPAGASNRRSLVTCAGVSTLRSGPCSARSKIVGQGCCVSDVIHYGVMIRGETGSVCRSCRRFLCIGHCVASPPEVSPSGSHPTQGPPLAAGSQWPGRRPLRRNGEALSSSHGHVGKTGLDALWFSRSACGTPVHYGVMNPRATVGGAARRCRSWARYSGLVLACSSCANSSTSPMSSMYRARAT